MSPVRAPRVVSGAARALAGALVVWSLALSALVAFPRAARAYDFSIDLATIGQGYQVRRFGATGADELLTRRRLTQYLNLNVYNIEPDAWRGDGPTGEPQRSQHMGHGVLVPGMRAQTCSHTCADSSTGRSGFTRS